MRPTDDEPQSCEKIFTTNDRQNLNPYCILYELIERSRVNSEGDITQENHQEHHLVEHEMGDVDIASITSTAYDQHIDISTENSYCTHVYNNPSNPDSEFESDLNQRAKISKMMGSIYSVTKKDTTRELFSDPIMGHLKEIEGQILISWVLKL